MTQEEANDKAEWILAEYRDGYATKVDASNEFLKLLDEVVVTPSLVCPKCGKKSVTVVTEHEGTSYYWCSECDLAVDPFNAPLDLKDRSAVATESQLMLILRYLQTMMWIVHWEGKDTCDQGYDRSDCEHCSNYHFCALDDLVRNLIVKMESGGTV